MKQNNDEIKISVSTNPPKIEELLVYMKKIDKTNADYIHCDIMDGRFVYAKTFDHKMVKEIKNVTDKPLDVHLMVKNPYFKIKKYVKAGADILTIHYESFKAKKNLIKCLKKIYKYGARAGLSFSPSTDVCDVLPFIPFCQNVLLMSVIPGKSGQKFIENSTERVEEVVKFIKEAGLDDVTLEIDGGINKDNIMPLKKKGVDIFVVGNYLYTSEDVVSAVDELKTIK